MPASLTASQSSSRAACNLAISIALVSPGVALAHPGHDAGFFSALLHPFIGWDHLLAAIAVGIWGARFGARSMWLMPIVFVGAMLAGMALAETTEGNNKVHQLTSGVTEFLVPFFLVNIGMQLNLSVFRDSSVVVLAIIITVAAVITKFIGGGLGVLGMKRREIAQVGVGMIPRGEVGIVVAQIGLGMAVISQQFFASVLFMAVATTLIAPPLIKIFFAEDTDNDGIIDELEERDVSDEYSRLG